ncbi:hypothetical protein O181_008740 [Austropuccinia psidii MF-1]|uniref:Uncharacterized protein n=1 Tax=Austropuccinia psidii MF-1 TaxID=1389203 RepID=A0A9Q3BPY2_9BASI|nr:hypothetical protein [Austropuccinia psidii MF-1]
MASGNYHRPPVTFKKDSPQDQGNFGPSQWTQACRNQDWCIYGIYLLLFLYPLEPYKSSSTEGLFGQRTTHGRGSTIKEGRKEGRGPNRASSFSGVVGFVPGISRTTLKGTGENDAEEEENSVAEEESDSTKVAPTPVGESQLTGGPNLSRCNQPVSNGSEPSLLTIMRQMTQIISDLQSASSSEASRLHL